MYLVAFLILPAGILTCDSSFSLSLPKCLQAPSGDHTDLKEELIAYSGGSVPDSHRSSLFVYARFTRKTGVFFLIVVRVHIVKF